MKTTNATADNDVEMIDDIIKSTATNDSESVANAKQLTSNNVTLAEDQQKPVIAKLDVPLLSSTTTVHSNSRAPTYQADVYQPPEWALVCSSEKLYKLEVIKNGIQLTDCTTYLTCSSDESCDSETSFSYCLIGRQPKPYYQPVGNLYGQCVSLAHPSISRLHAVLQYGKPPANIALTDNPETDTTGWYIRDFNSTHGTFVNKRSLPPDRYVRVRVGYVFRFGGSTRLHIFHGPSEDVEQQTPETWTELKMAYEARQLKVKQDSLSNSAIQEQSVNLNCNWGISIDDAASEITSFNAAAYLQGGSCLMHEKLYHDDPKRTLNAYFDREGIDPAPQYEFLEAGFGKQHCRIELPLSSGTVTAEVIVGGKRKEAVVACALEACQLLDRLGEFDPDKGRLTGSKQTRSLAYWEENDYYSSDEDTFTDRTGLIEQKRLERMRHLGANNEKQVEAEAAILATEHSRRKTDSLHANDRITMLNVLSELEHVGEEIICIEERLSEISKELTAKQSNPTQLDELDAYMNALRNDKSIPKERSELKAKLFKLRQKEMQLFHRAGIPQLRHRMAQRERSDANSKSFTLTSDAASAVRAAKQKLEKSMASALTNDACTGEINKSGSANIRANLDALKRSLPSYSKSMVKTRTSIDVDRPFEADEDDEDVDDDGDNIGNNHQSTHTKQSKPNLALASTDSSASKTVVPHSDIPIASNLVEGSVELPTLYHAPSPTTKKLAMLVDDGVDKTHAPKVTESNEQSSTPTSSTHNQDLDEESVDHQTKLVETHDTVLEQSQHMSMLPTQTSRNKNKDQFQEIDPDYIEWIPPTDQRGDGITSLNFKYGY